MDSGLDTGVLYAALDEADPDHEACAELLDHRHFGVLRTAEGHALEIIP